MEIPSTFLETTVLTTSLLSAQKILHVLIHIEIKQQQQNIILQILFNFKYENACV